MSEKTEEFESSMGFLQDCYSAEGADKRKLEEFMAAFRKRFEDPQIGSTVDEFYDREEKWKGITVSGEGGNTIDGAPAFDYYAPQGMGIYDGNVLFAARRWLLEHKFEVEWHDPGTVFLIRITKNDATRQLADMGNRQRKARENSSPERIAEEIGMF